MALALQPELLLAGDKFLSGHSLVCGDDGVIAGIARNVSLPSNCGVVRLPGRALLPGMVNAHSHSFQRLLRGRADRAVPRADGAPTDFWSWRDVMYAAALRLTPDDVYDVARMAFLEMLQCGTTAVGEFHYLHRALDGRAYADGNELARQVVRAAQSVGISIALLRCAYFRAGYKMPPDPGQMRFYEPPEEFLRNAEMLLPLAGDGVSIGVAPHSTRAVPLAEIRRIAAFAEAHTLAIHMHVSEQRAELAACEAEYGATPVSLLAREGLLNERFTGIHAIHVSAGELDSLAHARATVCCCPTTERNLGDGIFPARDAAERGVRIVFGSDSQVQIAPLEDARAMEYHLRLRDEKRLRLEHVQGRSMAGKLYQSVSRSGAESLRLPTSCFTAGNWADAFTVGLDDITLAGAHGDDLLSAIVFGAAPSAVKDVFVRGRRIVENGQHTLQQEIIERYSRVARRVWQ